MAGRVASMATRLQGGERRALSKAITLVESSLPAHREEAAHLLQQIGKTKRDTFRIGISGAPGAGKSTFIEAFGKMLTEQGHKLAVLAVDPSSNRTGGSILGDKTRMDILARDPNAYVRPSPNRGALGGVNQSTYETIALCEGGGYDLVLVETVGVGQSEVMVDDMVDLFVLLCPPGAGDELQGIKRGVMEVADLVVITKADGKLKPISRHAKVELMHAMQLMRPKHEEWKAKVVQCSAKENLNIEKAWETMREFKAAMQASGKWESRRALQLERWMWTQVHEDLRTRLQENATIDAKVAEIQQMLREGKTTPRLAARSVIDTFFASGALTSGT